MKVFNLKYDNKLKEIRARHGVSQEQIAKFLGIGVGNYRKKEKKEAQFKEKEMYLCVFFFNYFYGEMFMLDDLFSYLVNVTE